MKVRLDASGRLYLPSELRAKTSTSEYAAELKDDGTILLRPIIADPVEEYYGSVKSQDMSPEEIDAKIKEEVKKRLIHNDIH